MADILQQSSKGQSLLNLNFCCCSALLQDSNGSSTAAKADGSSHAAKRQRLAMPAEDSFQNGAAAPRQSEELSQRWKPSDIDEGQVSCLAEGA